MRRFTRNRPLLRALFILRLVRSVVAQNVELSNAPNFAVPITKAAREAYAQLKQEITNVWGDQPKLFKGQFAFGKGAQEIVISKMLDAVVRQRPLVWSFTGTSVTAGHDNLYEQSYPRVVHRMMGAVFNVTGATFEGRNGGMGNNPAQPYSECLEAVAGSDADLVVWEQMMNVAGGACRQRAAPEIELFVRRAFHLPKRPAVLVVANVADGSSCEKARLGTRLANVLDSALGHCNGKSGDLVSTYGRFGLHTINPEVSLFNSNACSSRGHYSFDYLVRQGKEGMGHGAPWHPGPHGHELMGAMLSLNYLSLFLEALKRIDAVFPDLTREQLAQPSVRNALINALGLEYSPAAAGADINADGGETPLRRALKLPEPLLCGHWRLCSRPDAFRCATSFSPVYQADLDLKKMVKSPLRPAERALEPPFGGAVGQWAVILSEEKLLPIPDPTKVYPLDNKWTLVGRKGSGPLEIGFAVRQGSGPVGLCKPHIVSRAAFTDSSAVRYEVDGFTVTAQEWSHPGNGQCVWLSVDVCPGNHTLRVLPSASTKFVGISHMIFPA